MVTDRERYHSPGHRAAVWDVVFSADGRFLASASSDSTALLWDLTGRPLVARRAADLPAGALTGPSAVW